MSEDEMIEAAIKKFPQEFKLRGFPGVARVRFNAKDSFVNRAGEVVLYAEMFVAGTDEWASFAKGAPSEFRQEIVAS